MTQDCYSPYNSLPITPICDCMIGTRTVSVASVSWPGKTFLQLGEQTTECYIVNVSSDSRPYLLLRFSAVDMPLFMLIHPDDCFSLLLTGALYVCQSEEKASPIIVEGDIFEKVVAGWYQAIYRTRQTLDIMY